MPAADIAEDEEERGHAKQLKCRHVSWGLVPVRQVMSHLQSH